MRTRICKTKELIQKQMSQLTWQTWLRSRSKETLIRCIIQTLVFVKCLETISMTSLQKRNSRLSRLTKKEVLKVYKKLFKMKTKRRRIRVRIRISLMEIKYNNNQMQLIKDNLVFNKQKMMMKTLKLTWTIQMISRSLRMSSLIFTKMMNNSETISDRKPSNLALFRNIKLLTLTIITVCKQCLLSYKPQLTSRQ